MSELFGAPSGVIAWDQNARANAESAVRVQNAQLDAQQKLNDLSLTPEKAALYKAQARNQNALAEEHEVATGIKRQQLGLEEMYKAYQKLGQEAGARGQMATWQDLPDAAQERNPDGTQSQRTLAQVILEPEYSITKPLEDKLAFLEKAGAPTVMMEPLIKEISKVKQEAAVTDWRKSQADGETQKQRQAQLKSIGGMAQAASQDPEAHAQLRMAFSSNQDPRVRALNSHLTGDFATDAPKLAAFARLTLDAQTQLENEHKKRKADLEDKQLEVTKGKARVAAGVAASRVKVLEAQAVATGKEEGVGTVNQVAVNDQKLYAAYQRDKKDREKDSPPAPLDKDFYLKRGDSQATYTLKNGSVARAVIKNGQVMWDVVKPPLKEVKPPRSIEDIAKGRKAAKAAAEDDLDDNTEL